MHTPVISDLGAADERVRAAARLLAQSVPAAAAGLVPYTAARYDRYLAAMLAPPASRRTAVVRVVEIDGEVVGVADWRVLTGTLFLNGIAVRADRRGLGLGQRLVADGIALAGALGRPALALDVACDNVVARRFYQRSGFVEGRLTCWHDCSAEQGAAPTAEARFTDWPLFQAALSAYGFGDLSVDVLDGPPARVRVVGDALRVIAADLPRLPLRLLRTQLGVARSVAVGTTGPGHTRGACGLLTFVQMHRHTTAEAAP